MESPDSIIPVFWIRISGLRPAAASPAAIEQAWPSRLTPTRRKDGSACINRNSQLVSLSGSQTTSVTPFAFICASTVSGLSATAVSLIVGSRVRPANLLPRQSDRQPARALRDAAQWAAPQDDVIA